MLSRDEKVTAPWPRLKGSFPDLFKRYYDEIDQGVRHPSGYLIKPVTDQPMDRVGWLETGIKNRETSRET